jgi:hypothetical protein
VNDSTKIEETLRASLRDAADHASLAAAVPLAEGPTRHSPARSGRTRVLAAACAAAVAVAVVVAGVALARDDDASVHVSSPSPVGREVPVADIEHGDLEVFMIVHATDDQVAAVRAALEASPDVARYAYLDRDTQYREFAEIFSCNPDLVHSVRPQDMPASFRVVAATPTAVAVLHDTFSAVPGVEEVQSPGGPPSTSHGECGATVTTSPPAPEPPTTAPATLPPAGEEPADPTAAHEAIVATVTQAWSGTSTAEQRRAAMQASDQLAPLLDEARATSEEINRAIGRPGFFASMHAVVDEIRFVTPERAAVRFHLEFDDTVGTPVVGSAVFDGGRWLLSRDAVCAVLQQYADTTCPAA